MAIAIDPEYCGCTECLTRKYVPLNQASAQQVINMLNSEIGNNTGYNTRKELLNAIAKCNTWAYDEVVEFLAVR